MRVHIRPILPKRPLCDPNELEAAIEEALDHNASDCKAEYEKTVATWKEQVTFTIRKTKFGRSVGTSNKIFGYVNRGTPPHKIPKTPRAHPLRFTTGGAPKTRVGVLTSGSGAKGTKWVSAAQVNHPGTKARKFSAIIQTRAKSRQSAYLKQAIRKAFGK